MKTSHLIRFFLIFLINWSVSTTAYSQTEPCLYRLSGYVYDRATQEALPGATVRLGGTSRGTVTDLDGYFLLENICEKEFDLLVSFVGYKAFDHHHDYHHEDVQIYLSPDGEMLEGIIVEGRRNTSSLQTATLSGMDNASLALVQSESLGDALSSLPGLSFSKAGQNVVNPMIHGLSGNRILIINNDVRHEYQNWDADHAPEIDLKGIDRVEVIKGAASVRFGSDALGGVVLLHPRDVELSSGWDVNFGFTGKTNGRAVEGDVELAHGSESLTLRAFGSILRQGDLKAPDYLLTNTGKREHSLGAEARLHLSPELDVRMSYSLFDQELGILRGAVNGGLDDLIAAIEADVPNDTGPFSYMIGTPKQAIKHEVWKAELQYIDNTQSARLAYSFQQNHRREFDVRKGNDLEIPNIDVVLDAHIVDADWSHPALGAWSGKLGFQFLYRNNENQPGTNTVSFIPNYNSNSWGLFLVESYAVGSNTVEFGMRIDHINTSVAGRRPDNSIFRNDIGFTNLSGIVGYKRLLREDITFSTNLGTAWRPPNVGELYRFGRRNVFIEYGIWRHEIGPDATILTDEVLDETTKPVKSEIAYKWINSLDVEVEDWWLNTTIYANLIKNFIYSRPAGLTRTVRGAAPYFIYAQQDAFFAGLDLSVRRTVSKQVSSEFTGSYLYADQVDRDGYFAGLPPPQITNRWDISPTVSGLDQHGISLEFAYTFKQALVPRILTIKELLEADMLGIELFGDQAEDFDIADAPEDYFLINLSWSATWKKLSWSVQVKNLLDTSYRHYTDRIRYFADDTGRNVALSVRYSW